MTTTTDPNDPRLGYGVDEEPAPQNEAYLVPSEKPLERPVRYSYRHVGPPPPQHPLRDLTEVARRAWGEEYVKFETYPEGSSAVGRFWRQADLDNRGCGQVTSMSQSLAEAWACDPKFYGATYCTGCQKHLRVNEFTWTADGVRLGE